MVMSSVEKVKSFGEKQGNPSKITALVLTETEIMTHIGTQELENWNRAARFTKALNPFRKKKQLRLKTS
jgi:hypothetical protein